MFRHGSFALRKKIAGEKGSNEMLVVGRNHTGRRNDL